MLQNLILTDEMLNDPYPEKHPWSIRVQENRGDRTVTITQGGYGARPIFVGRNSHNRVISSNFADVARRMDTLSPSLEGRLDLLLLGHTADTHTLFTQIERLPAGDRHVLSDETIRSEWSDRVIDQGAMDIKTAADIFIALLRERIQQKSTGWLPLTGGVDSRAIAAHLADTSGIRAYTRGDASHPEVTQAARIARILQISHYPMPFTPPYFERYHADILMLTGGMISLDHCHAIHPLQDMKCLSTGIVIPGSNGEYGRAFWPETRSSRPSVEQVALSLFGRQTGARKNRYASLLTPDARSVIETCRQMYLERYSRIADNARYRHPIAWNDEFYLRDRVRSFSIFGAVIWGSFFALALPFLEYDYVQAVRALPPELRAGPDLQREIIRRGHPKLLSVPLYPSGRVLQPRFFDRIFSGVRRRLLRRRAHISVQNYAEWLRIERAFIEPFVEKAHQSFCGLVDDAIVKRLWTEHLAGADHHRILCRLITPVMVDTLFT